jgi:hypothetical protein
MRKEKRRKMECDTKWREKSLKIKTMKKKGPFLYWLLPSHLSLRKASRVGKLYGID